jgi:hypothetical protein
MKNPYEEFYQVVLKNNFWHPVIYTRLIDFEEVFIFDFNMDSNRDRESIVNYSKLWRSCSSKSSEDETKFIAETFSKILGIPYGGKLK